MKYRFLEALDKIVGTKRRLRKVHEQWNEYIDDDYGFLRKEGSEGYIDWWPTIDNQKAQIWEVEPEPIYVWCNSYEGGVSILHTDVNDLSNSKSQAEFSYTNLFENNQLQKFKLVPVED